MVRTDFSTKLIASGRIESVRKTIIECELERIEIRNEGRSIVSGGASTLLTVIEEGSRVKKGDVLCTLDASDYEELVRQQEIKTQQARAALLQAQLDLQVAELGIQEYRDGLMKQAESDLEGQIAFAESDVERAVDRLAWTRGMLQKGYVPKAQLTTAEQTEKEARQQLLVTRWELENMRKFGHSRAMLELTATVEKCKSNLVLNEQRVMRLEERLRHYKRMVELCTIRAPHDGFVIFAVDPWRPGAPRIEPGVQVRQHQKLFYLPDLGDMEIQTYLHESIANQVQPGMMAKAKVEGLSNRMIEGHVTGVAPLPLPEWNWSQEVKYFVGHVKLDSAPEGIRPGMTAEVEIQVNRSTDVLAVPTEAIRIEKGHEICYVAGHDGLERRHVTVGRASRDLLEVTGGLVEGEQVVITPVDAEAQIEAIASNSSSREAETPSTPDFPPPATGSGTVAVD